MDRTDNRCGPVGMLAGRKATQRQDSGVTVFEIR
jgi:hypothetical protein